MEKAKDSQKAFHNADREHKNFKARHRHQSSVVAALSEEAKAANQEKAKKEKAVAEVKRKQNGTFEEWCAREFQSCGTPGTPSCCQTGCSCEGDLLGHSKTCRINDGSGTCSEAGKKELADELAQKVAERDRARAAAMKKARALEDARDSLREITKSLEESEVHLATKKQFTKALARNLQQLHKASLAREKGIETELDVEDSAEDDAGAGAESCLEDNPADNAEIGTKAQERVLDDQWDRLDDQWDREEEEWDHDEDSLGHLDREEDDVWNNDQ